MRMNTVARGGRADGSKDASTDNRADTQQGDGKRPETSFQLMRLIAQCRQNVVEVLGAKDSFKQVVRLRK